MLDFHEPSIADLWFKEKMMGDERTMSYNRAFGGTISFPKERWADWHSRWITNQNSKRFYRYIKENDTFVGEVAYYFDEEKQITLANVIVFAPYRGKGYGRSGLLFLCKTAKEKGITELYDNIAADNSSVSLFLKCGFVEVSRTNESVLVKKIL